MIDNGLRLDKLPTKTVRRARRDATAPYTRRRGATAYETASTTSVLTPNSAQPKSNNPITKGISYVGSIIASLLPLPSSVQQEKNKTKEFIESSNDLNGKLYSNRDKIIDSEDEEVDNFSEQSEAFAGINGFTVGKKFLGELIESMSVQDLRQQLREVGMDTTGFRQDLIDRLSMFVDQHPEYLDNEEPKPTLNLQNSTQNTMKNKKNQKSLTNDENDDDDNDEKRISSHFESYLDQIDCRNVFNDSLPDEKKKCHDSYSNDIKSDYSGMDYQTFIRRGYDRLDRYSNTPVQTLFQKYRKWSQQELDKLLQDQLNRPYYSRFQQQSTTSKLQVNSQSSLKQLPSSSVFDLQISSSGNSSLRTGNDSAILPLPNSQNIAQQQNLRMHHGSTVNELKGSSTYGLQQFGTSSRSGSLLSNSNRETPTHPSNISTPLLKNTRTLNHHGNYSAFSSNVNYGPNNDKLKFSDALVPIVPSIKRLHTPNDLGVQKRITLGTPVRRRVSAELAKQILQSIDSLVYPTVNELSKPVQHVNLAAENVSVDEEFDDNYGVNGYKNPSQNANQYSSQSSVKKSENNSTTSNKKDKMNLQITLPTKSLTVPNSITPRNDLPNHSDDENEDDIDKNYNKNSFQVTNDDNFATPYRETLRSTITSKPFENYQQEKNKIILQQKQTKEKSLSDIFTPPPPSPCTEYPSVHNANLGGNNANKNLSQLNKRTKGFLFTPPTISNPKKRRLSPSKDSDYGSNVNQYQDDQETKKRQKMTSNSPNISSSESKEQPKSVQNQTQSLLSLSQFYKPDQWKCPDCSVFNEKGDTKCLSCGFDNPNLTASKNEKSTSNEMNSSGFTFSTSQPLGGTNLTSTTQPKSDMLTLNEISKPKTVTTNFFPSLSSSSSSSSSSSLSTPSFTFPTAISSASNSTLLPATSSAPSLLLSSSTISLSTTPIIPVSSLLPTTTPNTISSTPKTPLFQFGFASNASSSTLLSSTTSNSFFPTLSVPKSTSEVAATTTTTITSPPVLLTPVAATAASIALSSSNIKRTFNTTNLFDGGQTSSITVNPVNTKTNEPLGALSSPINLSLSSNSTSKVPSFSFGINQSKPLTFNPTVSSAFVSAPITTTPSINGMSNITPSVGSFPSSTTTPFSFAPLSMGSTDAKSSLTTTNSSTPNFQFIFGQSSSTLQSGAAPTPTLALSSFAPKTSTSPFSFSAKPLVMSSKPTENTNANANNNNTTLSNGFKFGALASTSMPIATPAPVSTAETTGQKLFTFSSQSLSQTTPSNSFNGISLPSQTSTFKFNATMPASTVSTLNAAAPKQGFVFGSSATTQKESNNILPFGKSIPNSIAQLPVVPTTTTSQPFVIPPTPHFVSNFMSNFGSNPSTLSTPNLLKANNSKSPSDSEMDDSIEPSIKQHPNIPIGNSFLVYSTNNSGGISTNQHSSIGATEPKTIRKKYKVKKK